MVIEALALGLGAAGIAPAAIAAFNLYAPAAIALELTSLAYLLYKGKKPDIPPPPPASKKFLDAVKSQGNKAASIAAAAFLDAGRNAATILKESNFHAAAKLVGAHPTAASVAALLTAAGVSYAVVRKLKSLVSRKGGVSKITRTNTKKLKTTLTSLTSKPRSKRKNRSRSRSRRRR
jgi:chromate transport protein ChrA